MPDQESQLDCAGLHGRLRQICEGNSGLPAEVEQAYRDRWSGKTPGPLTISTACIHRGEVIRTDLCDQCGRKEQPFEVYACLIHKECSLTRKHWKVKPCNRCGDRKSA